jgi:hypothetical protein
MRWDLCSPTPPLEIVKAQLAMVAGVRGEPYCLLHSDVSRAYLNAPVKRDVYVMLPDEDDRGGKGMCGKLIYSMYGTREAATNWEEHYANWLKSPSFHTYYISASHTSPFHPCHPHRATLHIHPF